ncbi:methyl-accepting chemotaxis protein [Phaeobacter sp. HF9A]|uniref:methyl-accepting chemotaxis protein n=1 Tax=Phaeobacter sp. HF9A TaxID=2721561 RepID=UPI00142FED62|nr:globin-coupled sensor protein [Phaeobacter sp. HF9A]NIZ13410.1 globin-coupled sensor protein [Phaeobacter sp. HF9A]
MTDTDTALVLGRFGLQGEMIQDLRQANAIVQPMLDQVLTHFYDYAQSDAEAVAFFPDQSLLDHARKAQKRHWELLLGGDFPESYFLSAKRIGQVHFKIQLPFSLYLAGYAQATSYIQRTLIERASTLLSPPARKRLHHMLGALNRAFAMDTFFVIDAYFSAQTAEQEIAFDHLTKGVDRMASGDLTRLIPDSSESDYPQRYDGIRMSLNRLMTGMSDVIGKVQAAMATVSQTSGHLSDSAQNLAQRAEAQAATLEETAAAVEEITTSMRSSSNGTTETRDLARQTQATAEQGNEIVLQAVQKMEEIAQSSTQISQIISVIDDISFQTNLLALNAGVEAARAGEAGRGFAVVASEVRGLAQRAANSANEIKTLITVSGTHVTEGVELVNRAGTTLDRIVSDVKRVSELSATVASSVVEQSTGISEINTGISHLDTVTQENVAIAEQTASASHSLRKDTDALTGLIATFKVLSADATAHEAKAMAPRLVSGF